MEDTFVIIGKGISGIMMAAQLSINYPESKIIIIDKDSKLTEHVFHLHRPIEDIPSLSSRNGLVMKKFSSSTYDGKTIHNNPTIEDINRYSLKVFGHLKINNSGNSNDFTIFPVGKGKIVQALNGMINSEFVLGEVSKIDVKQKIISISMPDKTVKQIKYNYLINTISLPIFLKLCRIKHSINFETFPFYGATLRINETGCYQQFINSSIDNSKLTRVTLMNDVIFIESIDKFITDNDLVILEKVFQNKFSNLDFYKIVPGRITPISKEIRKPLIYWLTEKYDIMLLGRYGSWAYKVANDIWDDAKFLVELINVKRQSKLFEKGFLL